MGDDRVAPLDREVGPFATAAVDVAALLPEARLPQQIEVRAGKHMVRPRYEITTARGRARIARVNVERVDLEPDPAIADLGSIMGKGFILPAPVLPVDRWRTTVLPTPMAVSQRRLPIQAILYDADGREIARHRFGALPRAHASALDVQDMLARAGTGLPSGQGHVELIYDFDAGSEADGWLHAIFRYEDATTGHAAETSFGSHIFNTVLTYKSEPQSYAGRPPGLSTRLFLRLGPPGTDTLCHLIYPASTPWHPQSQPTLVLNDGGGRPVAGQSLGIPRGGSRLLWMSRVFDAAERAAAGDGGHVIVRDRTCRLFGYHGLATGAAFSLDHMFGF